MTSRPDSMADPPASPGDAGAEPGREEGGAADAGWAVGLSAGSVWLIALGLRLWHWSEIRVHDPFFGLPAVDGAYYHAWAMQLAEGDWLGEGVFHNSPLYPYLLGVLYAWVGPSVGAAKLLHIALGLLTCHAVWATARRLFDLRVACAAGLLMAACEMAVFYTGTLVLVNLTLPLAALAVWAAVSLQARPAPGLALACGLGIGIGVLARPNLLLFAVALALWLPLVWKLPRARSALLVGLLILGTALPILPVTLRNAVVGGDWVLVTSSGGMNLFMGNNPDANGLYRVPRIFSRSATDDPVEQNAAFAAYAEQRLGRELRPSEVSAFWRDQAWAFVRSEPGRWMRLVLRKLAHATNAYEPWNIRSITLSRDFSRVLRLPLVSFGLLLPLAALGAVLCWRDWRRLMPVYLLIATLLATLLVFFVTARYRLPVLPGLAVLAGAGLVEAVRCLRGRAFKRLGLAALVALGVALHAQRPLASEDLSIAYYNLGNRYRSLERPEEAVRAYQRTLRARPGYLPAWNNLALVLEAQGRSDAAIAAWQTVLELGRRRGSARHVERATRRLRGLGAGPAEPADPE